jgi:predicted ABC-type transport system involved in lysophospholipase L1 biosynthesis ATPase subunit
VPGATLDVTGLTHRYRSRAGDLTVLEGLDLHVDADDHVVITGSSGSGKSTLLAVLGGLDAPQSGDVVVAGHDLHRLGRNDLADYRREIVGFVFQHFGLLDTLTAAENVELACTLAGHAARHRRRRAAELLGAVGLADRSDHRTSQLSGGERQRVAVARALANEPRLVLADEPTGNLDDDSSQRVVDLLESLPHDHGCTLVIVTHDHRLTPRARRHLHLADGRLREIDTGRDDAAPTSAAAAGPPVADDAIRGRRVPAPDTDTGAPPTTGTNGHHPGGRGTGDGTDEAGVPERAGDEDPPAARSRPTSGARWS